MTQVTIVTGCAGTGKTGRLLEEYCAALDRARTERRPGTTLWLTPTRRIQKAVVRQIVARCGQACFSPNVLTFDLFAEKILEAAGRPASPISPVMKRLLLRRITATLLQQGELQHFRSIAGTTGFLDVVSSFISELKREEIWPVKFISACQQRTSAFARRDLELGLIYDQYQNHLTAQNWYDNEGRFWLARTALGEGKRGAFADVRFLVVDGFTDFTQTQYEILGHFANWIEDVFVALPVEHPLTRTDLFSKPQAAIGRIRTQLPNGTAFRVDPLQPDANIERSTESLVKRHGWSDSICMVADRLFSNPRYCQPSIYVGGLEIITATGQHGEWEAVARRIKDLLAIGTSAFLANAATDRSTDQTLDASTVLPVHPQDIVVGLRSVSDDGPRLRDYLASAGLPVWCEAESPFTSSSIVKAVLLLLQFEMEDWPFDRLLAVLDSNFFRPKWPEFKSGQATRATAAFLRRLRLHEGRETILRVLTRYASEMPSASPTRGDSTAELARLGLPLLARLSRSLDKLRRSYTLGEWADLLAALADDLGWTRQPESSEDTLAANESRDLDLLQRILRTAAEADQKLAGTDRPKVLTLVEFVDELRDLLSHETLNSPIEPGGCIRILSVEQIRNLDVPHLFLIGLTENSFPMNRADDCLFSESERQDFIARGIALSHRSRQHADEMFLFYSVVTRARQSLTLSYPVVNSKGQPVFPSPYATALKSLFDPGSLIISAEGQLNPVPSGDRVLTSSDLRLVAMEQAQKGHPQLFRAAMEFGPLRRACWNTLAACDLADHRFHQRGFTGYEGQLDLPQNLDRLQQRFGSRHQFSATELEAYARCPFQFWLSNVLRIDQVESPEEGTDYVMRGTLLHEVLAELLIEGVMSDPTVLRNRFRELVDERLDQNAGETALQRALVEIERLTLFRWADAFAEQQGDYDLKIGETLKMTRSLAPEIPFGSLPDIPMLAANSQPPIQFGDGTRTVNLRGRIDRVDIGSFEGHPAYVVVDYKTGHRPSTKDEDLVSGHSIQLALYLLAIKRLGLVGPDAVPFQMGYWVLRDTGFKHAIGKGKLRAVESAELQRLEEVLDRLLPELADEIRSGRFVVENEDPNCTGRCPYRTVCRVNQLRPLAAPLGKLSPHRVDPSADNTSSE